MLMLRVVNDLVKNMRWVLGSLGVIVPDRVNRTISYLSCVGFHFPSIIHVYVQTRWASRGRRCLVLSPALLAFIFNRQSLGHAVRRGCRNCV